MGLLTLIFKIPLNHLYKRCDNLHTHQNIKWINMYFQIPITLAINILFHLYLTYGQKWYVFIIICIYLIMTEVADLHSYWILMYLLASSSTNLSDFLLLISKRHFMLKQFAVTQLPIFWFVIYSSAWFIILIWSKQEI